jgi:uncharacterized MAPEG superfamily protein
MNMMSMPETTMLLWSVALGLVQLVIASIAMNKDVGLPYNLSSRDVPPAAPIGKMAGRLVRAFNNFRETFGFFAVAVLLVAVLNRADHTSMIGAQLYFWARLAFVPIYALGIIVVRTIVWAISIVGLVMVLLAAFGAA